MYKYDGVDSFEPLETILAKDISLGKYTKLKKEDVAVQWPEPEILVFVPANKTLTSMHKKGDIEYANIYNDGTISIDASYYPVSTHPPKPQDFFWGPAGWANRQSNLRQYFNVGGENVIW